MLGVNDRVALARVRQLAQEAIHERHMRAGVDIVDPAATVIDVDVEIGARHRDRAVHDDPGTHDDRRGCTVRHSYLRRLRARGRRQRRAVRLPAPGTVLREGAKAGTFVEVKNSDIGAGRENPAPVLHRRRRRGRAHEPRRGDDHRQLRRSRQAPHDDRRRVRTGVDTTLVAPVTVGDDAYTGAGSVITEDVPPGALAMRAGQAEEHRGLRRAQARA